jgi:hypothetical protein
LKILSFHIAEITQTCAKRIYSAYPFSWKTNSEESNAPDFALWLGE